MTPCSHCTVRQIAICRSLAAGELDELSGLGRRQAVRKNQALVWQGDKSLLVGNVIEGVFKLTVANSDGRDQTLGIMFPGDFIGRPFGETSDHSIVALTEGRVCTFPRSAFDGFARRHPELEHGLLRRTLTELDRSRHWMLLLGRKSATERVAAFLLEIAARLTGEPLSDGSPEPIRFRLPFGRQDIAELLGLTIETVSRQLTRLREDGIIDTPDRRTIVVFDREALADCAGEG